MHHRPFQQVDVFTAAYRGNPLAVVLDGTGLSTEEMQQFTRWTNLEATFVLPPRPRAALLGADYRVRIFYPAGEPSPCRRASPSRSASGRAVASSSASACSWSRPWVATRQPWAPAWRERLARLEQFGQERR